MKKLDFSEKLKFHFTITANRHISETTRSGLYRPEVKSGDIFVTATSYRASRKSLGLWNNLPDKTTRRIYNYHVYLTEKKKKERKPFNFPANRARKKYLPDIRPNNPNVATTARSEGFFFARDWEIKNIARRVRLSSILQYDNWKTRRESFNLIRV